MHDKCHKSCYFKLGLTLLVWQDWWRRRLSWIKTMNRLKARLLRVSWFRRPTIG
ncbi:hypothetical protein HanHA300_Chr17g0653761 [Helianthus annuus]|nr:hypothetical protein HanHA300_Chr17g0653761 [Helianthus annuus]KAJ0447478.1 hypothetical protein HanHA89_Chr17g0705851 [Helianthus annuus]KAJ0632355.1 hypothetical protein HanLR1_Chr17g0664221 [Helianthus annuus]